MKSTPLLSVSLFVLLITSAPTTFGAAGDWKDWECRKEFGEGSEANSVGAFCTCKPSYHLENNYCVPGSEGSECERKYGENAEHKVYRREYRDDMKLNELCYCKTNYRVNAEGTSCIEGLGDLPSTKDITITLAQWTSKGISLHFDHSFSMKPEIYHWTIVDRDNGSVLGKSSFRINWRVDADPKELLIPMPSGCYQARVQLHAEFTGGATSDVLVFNAPSNPCAGGNDTQAVFSDITNHPYKKAIESLYDRGVISGYSDGTFKPDASINRAEFTKIVITSKFTDKALEICDPNQIYSFSDASRSEWYAAPLCVAVQHKIIGGYSDGTFHPERTINIAEAAKIVASTDILDAAGHPAGSITESGGAWYQKFIDYISDRNARPSSAFPIDKTMTRGEMAEMMYRLSL